MIRLFVLMLLAGPALLTGCASTDATSGKGAGAAQTQPEEETEAEAGPEAGKGAAAEEAKPQPARPQLTGAAAQKEVQRILTQSRIWLNEGEEDKARGELEYAKQLDPENRQVACLLKGVTADPVAIFGSESTPYTVRPGDILGNIAQRFLGDSCEFYLLARYNSNVIKVPKQLSAGQILRIPGRVAAAQPPPPAPPAAPTPKPQVRPPEPAVAVKKPEPPPPPPQPPAEDPKVKQAAIDRHYRSGQAAYTRQDLPTAIREFDAVLALDPNHVNARARRQQAVELQAKLDELKRK